MPNINAVLSYTLSMVNVAQSTTPASIQWNGNTIPCTQVWYDLYYQVTGTPTAVPVPSLTNYLLYIRNLDPTNDITAAITYQSGGGTASAVVKSQGGIYLYYQPNNVGTGGIFGVNLSAPSVTPCEIMVGY